MPFKMLSEVTELDIQVGCDKAQERGSDTLPVDRPFNCCYLRRDVPQWIVELVRSRIASHRTVLIAPVRVSMVENVPEGVSPSSIAYCRTASDRCREVVAFRRELLIDVLGTFLEDPTAVLSCSFPSMQTWYTKEEGAACRRRVHGMHQMKESKDGE